MSYDLKPNGRTPDDQALANERLGAVVLQLERLLATLYNDKELGKRLDYWAVIEGCNRLMEGKMWLTAVMTMMPRPKNEPDLSKVSEKTS